jgi:hypothetical protein
MNEAFNEIIFAIVQEPDMTKNYRVLKVVDYRAAEGLPPLFIVIAQEYKK